MRTTYALLAAAALVSGVAAAPAPKELSLQGLHRVRPSRPIPAQVLEDLKSNVAEFKTKSDINDKPTVKAPYTNIWASLTAKEAADAVSYLHSQSSFNLTAAEDATTWDNWIGTVDLAHPKKDEALAYTASPDSVSSPDRYAKVLIHFQATKEPYLEEWLVGPLPLSNSTTAVPYVDGSTRHDGNVKQRDYSADSDLVYKFRQKQCSEIEDIVIALLGHGCDSFDIWGIDPLWHEEERVVSWAGFWGVAETPGGEGAGTLLPQGLYMKSDITGRDFSNFQHIAWLYNNKIYKTHDEFRADFASEGFETATRNSGAMEEWIGTDKAGEPLKYDDRAPPMQVQPEGNRFAVDEDQGYVEWGEFSFFIGFSRDTGVRLQDIKYKGDRILYELGLQEAVAHYSGADPVQSGTSYLDSFYGFGPYAFQLIPGYDCPSYATFLNATFHMNEVSTTHRGGICIFESDAGYPMGRHSTDSYVSVTKNIMFSLRSISTIGNYDYSFTYNFYQDGSIESVVQASGYIQSAFYAHNEEYGYKIQNGLSGSMHDHALTFKADFDILGTKNTFVKHTIEKASVDYIWSNTTRKTMKLSKSNITNEDDGTIQWPHNSQSMYMIVNHDEKNKYGEERGYRVMPSRGVGIGLTITESDNLFRSQHFATAPLFVTKHKDTEVAASHAANANDPQHPLIDFSTYLDGESLLQEDLVLWYNLGMHHVPHTGDLPNTVQTTAQSAIIFSPHNYLLGDPSRQTKQMIRLDYNSSADNIVSTAHMFGSHQASGSVNLTAMQTDFYAYSGDVNIRKFPYTPLEPYNQTVAE